MRLVSHCIFNQDYKFLPEWIAFYEVTGWDKVILSFSGEDRRHLEPLSPWIGSGFVDVLDGSPFSGSDIPAWAAYQINQQQQAIDYAKAQGYDWLALLDSDEYLLTLESMDIKETLKSYNDPDIGAIGVNWFGFGTSDIYEIPANQCMLETLIKCAGPDKHIKSLVKVSAVASALAQHYVKLKPGFRYVDETKTDFHGAFVDPPKCKKLRINHYLNFDGKAFDEMKRPRYKAIGYSDQDLDSRRNWANRNENLDIQKFVPALRKRLGHVGQTTAHHRPPRTAEAGTQGSTSPGGQVPPKQPKVAVTTIAPPSEPYLSEIFDLFTTLRHFGGTMANSPAIAYFLGPIPEKNAAVLSSLDVRVEIVEPLDIGCPQANKLLAIGPHPGVDYTLALDTDVVVAGDFSKSIRGNSVLAKIADQNPLHLGVWKRLFKTFGAPFPPARFLTSFGAAETLPYFNTAVLAVPSGLAQSLVEAWHSAILNLPGCRAQVPDIEQYPFLAHQFALPIALSMAGLSYRALPTELNFPTHGVIHNSFAPNACKPLLIRHNHRRDGAGQIYPCPYKRANEAIDRINAFFQERGGPAAR